jgi:hypothetical protein
MDWIPLLGIGAMIGLTPAIPVRILGPIRSSMMCAARLQVSAPVQFR